MNYSEVNMERMAEESTYMHFIDFLKECEEGTTDVL